MPASAHVPDGMIGLAIGLGFVLFALLLLKNGIEIDDATYEEAIPDETTRAMAKAVFSDKEALEALKEQIEQQQAA